ncbi:mitochondrial 3-hydroxyisobutyryl-hydrolase [Lasallia pustulata]|uniref:3-hydroxyisobutyryl-CoA hydrolase n=1 Tax=Lasallia pustulata TaxID=136370 RepID=A0A1W5CZW6_9LECA|nr:mitochondrial 3-hydroxyisobutyryl-hydrolase [Lasallia pustulata]
MPLKARILNPAIAGQAKMSTAVPIPREEPGDDPDDVLFNTLYGVRTIELNRPEKLNSLNGSMCRKIIPRLKEWEKSQLANVIIIAGTGPKAFCAGGDVAALAQLISKEGARGIQKSKDYFALEYRLDHLIATYSKPYIAYMDGITMGGGCGLSMHAPLRIATERTLFAMPETSIGFFPDVGASFFLPRLDGHTGTYLALTSSRLHGVNAFYAGIATHYIDSSSLGALTARLAELVFPDHAPLPTRLAAVAATLDEFHAGLPHDQLALFAGPLRQAIDRCFRHHALEDILAALRREEQSAGATAAWAAQTRRTLAERSPTSLKVALRAMRVAARWSIAETFQREWALAGKMVEHPDFVEGVAARLVAKPARAPTWTPGEVEEVGVEEVDRFFRVEGGRKLELLEGGMDYSEYPFAGQNSHV